MLAAAQPIAWIFRGDEQRTAVRFYALGLAGGLVACFFATVGPQRWLNAACDAYSLAHLAAGLAGAAALLALVAASPRLASPAARVIATAIAALAPLIAIELAAPACLGDPFVGLDPLVRAIWLEHVLEVQKLLDLARTQPAAALTIGAPVGLALLATLVCAALSRDLQRARLVLLAALIGVGLGMTFWGVRVYSSVAPLAAVGGAVAAVALAQRLTTSPLSAGLAALLCIPFSPFAFALALPADPATSESKSMSCLRPEAVKPLDTLAPGLVLAPIDLGSHLLAFTRHSVIGAPYHRGNHGNRLALDALLASPAEAEKIVRASGAAYVVICGALRQATIIAERAPDGLMAALLAGRTPDWLIRLDVKSEPNVAFAIKPSN